MISDQLMVFTPNTATKKVKLSELILLSNEHRPVILQYLLLFFVFKLAAPQTCCIL